MPEPRPSEPRTAPEDEAAATLTAQDTSQVLAHRTTLLLAIATATWALYTIIDGALGHRVGFAINLTAALGTGALTAGARLRPSSAVTCAHAAVALAIAGILGSALITGHTRSPVLWYMGVIPLFVGYLRGARATVAWSAACAVGVAAVEAWRQLAPITPEYIVGEVDLAGRIVTLIAVIAAFAITTTRDHQEQIHRQKKSKDMVRRLLEEAHLRAGELAAARDAALQASVAKGDFLAVMSHEIRTPLNAVLGFAGILLDGPLPAEQRELVRMIRKSGDTLLSLLNDILDFSKIEAGQMTLEREPFDVGDSAEDAADLFAAVAAEKQIDLSCHIAPGVPARIEGDATRVRQVLVNLVSNAVKFTTTGGIQVRVEVSPERRGQGEILIHCAVRDTGIGVPPDRLEAIFDRFSQADTSTTRRFGGTGLGLAICRSLAERMGGRLWAENNSAAGSTFHFTFCSRPLPHAPVAVSFLNPSGAVVVITSRAGTREAVTAQVEAMGFAAVPCANLLAGAVALRRAPASVVIADDAAATDELAALLGEQASRPAVILLAATGDLGARRSLRRRWPSAVMVPIPPRRSVLRDALLRALTDTGPDEGSGAPSLSAPLAAEVPLRILVAEDNPVNQRLMAMLLERMGYRPDMVGNGLEAIAAVREHPYDLVLMDMRMPELDGLDAAMRIRAELPPDRQPHIVALTANVTTEDRAQCREAGMDDFLSKPVTQAELFRVVTSAFGRGVSAGRAAARAPSTR